MVLNTIGYWGEKFLGTMLFLTGGVCVCMYFWPTVRVVCQDNEVVVLQTRTDTALDLGSISNYIFNSNPPAPPISTVFWIFSFPPHH